MIFEINRLETPKPEKNMGAIIDSYFSDESADEDEIALRNYIAPKKARKSTTSKTESNEE